MRYNKHKCVGYIISLENSSLSITFYYIEYQNIVSEVGYNDHKCAATYLSTFNIQLML